MKTVSIQFISSNRKLRMTIYFSDGFNNLNIMGFLFVVIIVKWKMHC